MLKFPDRTQLDTHAVGILHMSDQPVEEATTYTARNKHKRPISMPLAGFEPAILAVKQLQINTLDRAVTGINIWEIMARLSLYNSILQSLYASFPLGLRVQ
jgi:hypothetical protein